MKLKNALILTRQVTVVLAAYFLVIANTQASSSTCTPNSSWDWTSPSEYVEKDTSFGVSYSLPYPFDQSNIIGYDLNNGVPCSEDGWSFYSKELFCMDLITTNPILDEYESCKLSYKTPTLPWFALYNHHYGMIRLFVYVPDDISFSGKNNVTFSLSITSGDTRIDHPYFINLESPITPIEDLKSATDPLQSDSLMFPSYSDIWVVNDFYLSYPGEDPIESGLGLSLKVETTDLSTFEWSGEFSGAMSTIAKTQGDDNSPIGIAKALFDNKDSVSAAYASPKKWHEQITKQKASIDKYSEENPNHKEDLKGLSKDLGSLAGIVATYSSEFGAGAAAFAVYDIVTGLTSSGESVRQQFFSGEMNASGTYSDIDVAKKPIYLGLHGSAQSNERNESQLTLADENGNPHKLGLFHVKRKPRVIVRPNSWYHADDAAIALAYRVADDLKELIEVNPASEMEIADISAGLVVTKGEPFASLGAFRSTLPGLPEDLSIEPPTPTSLTGFRSSIYYGGCKNVDIMQSSWQCIEQQSANISATKKTNYREVNGGYNTHTYDNSITNYALGNTLEKGLHGLIGLRAHTSFLLGNYNLIENKDAGIPYIHWADGGEEFQGEWPLPISNYYKTEGNQIENLQLKVAIRFEHPERLDIFVDYIGILDVDVLFVDAMFAGNNPGKIFDTSTDLYTNRFTNLSISEYLDLDSDLDGIPDTKELNAGLNPILKSDASLDYDNDGLSNAQEISLGLNINSQDTDGDGMSDKWEHENGLNPLTDDASLDSDEDGATNLEEFQANSDPFDSTITPETMLAAWLVPVTALILN